MKGKVSERRGGVHQIRHKERESFKYKGSQALEGTGEGTGRGGEEGENI